MTQSNLRHSACACGCHTPSRSVVPSDYYREQARNFIEGNAERYPELLLEQFARALNNESLETANSVRVTEACVVLFRMLQRAGKLKPETDDERAVLKLAQAWLAYPASMPAGSRRIASPFLSGDAYDDDVADVVRRSLFDLPEVA